MKTEDIKKYELKWSQDFRVGAVVRWNNRMGVQEETGIVIEHSAEKPYMVHVRFPTGSRWVWRSELTRLT